MPKFTRKMSKTAGLAPGTPVYTGEEKAEKIKIVIIDYDETTFQEKRIGKVQECFPFKETSTISWINIDGIHDIGLVEKIAQNFGLHPLVLEDIVNTEQRPKYEVFDEYIFIVLKMLYYDGNDGDVKVEQVSLILGSNFVISFQEKEGDVFDPVRERIRQDKGRIRKMKADYLAHALMDAIVDNYFFIIEKMGEEVEVVEEELIFSPDPRTLQDIQHFKRDITFLRRSVWPLREVINGLLRGESPLIEKSTTVYLRDIYEHTIQVIDTIEALRDVVAGMLDIYLSSLSYKMNEIMKVLTIIATIFIPLTFIAGLYGMNFKYMPELNWPFGYALVLLIMIVIAVYMLSFFRRKKWL